MPLPRAEGDAIGAVDVDAHIGRRRRIVGRRAQRLAQPGVLQQSGTSAIATTIATAQAIEPRLVQEHAWRRRRTGPISKARDASGVRTVCGVEPNTISPPFCRISEMPKRDDKLAEMAIVDAAGGAQAGDTRDQELVQQRAAGEHDRAGQQRADERADIGPQERRARRAPVTRYRLAYMPSISSSPWAKLTMRMMPKISPSPMHIRP